MTGRGARGCLSVLGLVSRDFVEPWRFLGLETSEGRAREVIPLQKGTLEILINVDAYHQYFTFTEAGFSHFLT